jgi:ABC-type transporter Mla subunit MlaD
MAQALIGADIQQLQRAAETFGRKGARLRQLVAELAKPATAAGMWTGPDADNFRAAWPKIANTLTTAADQLVAVQRQLGANASQQSAASGS